MKTNNFGATDYFRIIAAALVISIHAPAVPFLGDAGNLLLSGTFARLAVPFFFAVTGFFTDLSSAAAVKKLLVKTALIYAAATAVYLPYGTYFANIKQILFDGTFYHLWYFPAVMMGAVIVFWLKKLPTVPAVVIASLLYTFGLCGDSYRNLANFIEPLSKTLDVLSNVFSFTRNGLFFAPMFLLLGNILGNKVRRALDEKRSPINLFIAIPCFLLSLGMLVSERFSLKEITFAPNNNMFISLVPCTIFLLLILSAVRLKPQPVLRQISMWIYIVHPIIIDLINRITIGFDKVTGTFDDNAQNVIFSASISLATAVVFGILFSVKKAKSVRIP
ncbi:MAG: acyltransferase family protein [Oscillospiraceae bacterium]